MYRISWIEMKSGKKIHCIQLVDTNDKKVAINEFIKFRDKTEIYVREHSYFYYDPECSLVRIDQEEVVTTISIPKRKTARSL